MHIHKALLTVSHMTQAQIGHFVHIYRPLNAYHPSTYIGLFVHIHKALLTVICMYAYAYVYFYTYIYSGANRSLCPHV